MKDLIIAGAGGFGREALGLAKTLNKIEPRWNIKGFINDIPDALDGVKCSHSIIGTIKDWQPSDNEVFVIGISSPQGKEKVANILKSKGAKFVSLIHPAALVSEDAIIGTGCVITGRSVVGGGTQIGDFVHIASSMVGQDAVIGDFSTTTAFANLTNAHLGKRVFVGSHAVILNKLKIGDDAFVCVGSIVYTNVKAGSKVFGNPARRIKT
jgi:sugar O-acyltransferase (sialic acid O-acetyltransferase NeuD family)